MPTSQDSPQPSLDSPPIHTLSTLLPLLHESLAQEGRFVLPLAGTSMLPTLPITCRVEIVPLPDDAETLPLGSLIVFVAGDALITHRLVARRPIHGVAMWIPQGDGRRVADAPIRPEQVLGQVVRALDEEGRVLWSDTEARWRVAAWVWRYHGLARLRSLWRWLRGR